MVIIKAVCIFTLDISLHFFPLKYLCLALLAFAGVFFLIFFFFFCFFFLFSP